MSDIPSGTLLANGTYLLSNGTLWTPPYLVRFLVELYGSIDELRSHLVYTLNMRSL